MKDKDQALAEVRKFMMDTGDVLDLIERSAQRYFKGAPDSLIRSAKMYRLSAVDTKLLSENKKQAERLVVAVLADFINHIALERDGNRGEGAEHIRKRPTEE